jgi:hypothetical protein
MTDFDMSTLLQLGPLAIVLLYIVIRLEGAMTAVACALGQVSKILLLLLHHAGVDDDQALTLCADAATPRTAE